MTGSPITILCLSHLTTSSWTVPELPLINGNTSNATGDVSNTSKDVSISPLASFEAFSTDGFYDGSSQLISNIDEYGEYNLFTEPNMIMDKKTSTNTLDDTNPDDIIEKNTKNNVQEHLHDDETDSENIGAHEEASYFDSSMQSSKTAYLGKFATLTCVVHGARTDRSVSLNYKEIYSKL